MLEVYQIKNRCFIDLNR